MKQMRLGDVAQFINGAAFRPTDWSEAGLPIVRIQNLTDPGKPFNRTTREVPDALRARPGDLLVSWSATLGVFTWAGPEDALVNQHIFRVVPNDSVVEKRYLRHMLEGALSDMERHLHGATMKHVNRGEFLGTEIPIPPLEEQRRIAAILDEADVLRTKRRWVLELADELVSALYNSMVVRHANRDRWATVTVAALAADHPNAIRTGPFGSQLLHSEFTENGIAVLGIDNAVAGEFRWGRPRFISEAKYALLRRYTVHPGDVLITIMGTCGRCAVVPDDIPVAINTKHLCCITLDNAQCTPKFLWAAFKFDPEARAYLARHSKGAVMDGLNMSIIKGMPIRIPPLPVQEAFERAAQALDEFQRVQQASSDQLDSLFAALAHQAFKGEL